MVENQSIKDESTHDKKTVYPDFSGHERKVEIMDKWTEEDKSKMRSEITVVKAKKKVQERTEQYRKGKRKERIQKKKAVIRQTYHDIGKNFLYAIITLLNRLFAENVRMMEDNIQVTENEVEQVDVRIRRREMLLVRDEHDVYGFQNETARDKLRQYLSIKKYVKWFISDIIKNAVPKVEEMLIQQGQKQEKIVVEEETLLKITEFGKDTVEHQLCSSTSDINTLLSS